MKNDIPPIWLSLLMLVVSAYFLFMNYLRRIRLAFRAGCAMWLVLFLSLGFLFFGIVELFK